MRRRAFYIAVVSLCVLYQVRSTTSQTIDGSQAIFAQQLQGAQRALQSGHPQDAIGIYRSVLAVDADNLEARANLGVVLYFQQQYQEATEELRKTLKLDPSQNRLRALLGMCERRSGKLEEAARDLAAAFPNLMEEKLKVQVGLELIELDYALNHIEEAPQVVKVLRRIRPSDPDILYTAHRVYSDLSDETTLSLAMAAPDSARMHQLIAHEMARQANREGAITNYRQALRLHPQLSGAHFELGEMLRTESDRKAQEQAEEEYKLALAQNPWDEKALCKLGELSLKKSEAVSAAGYFQRALELQREDPDANFGLARALLSQGKGPEAEPYLRKAVRLEPFLPGMHYRLALLYRSLGRREEADQELAQFEKLKSMRSKLQSIYEAMHLPWQSEKDDAQAEH